ncbi:GAF domain-containing protein [Cellulophaga baltica]|uniref:histidine kinase n=2 Tax=Cellulophaga baltica TaxID=76594 RepID=A0A1G7D6B2_9FLAO|nr:GAF domain-containing protein [Cellulophaga baltica]
MSSNNENERLETVQRFLQLDYNKSTEFQDIVDLASQLCEMSVALITLLDKNVNWLKVRSGVDLEVMPRETSFCQYGIQQDNILIIPDATKDSRFNNNPLVQSDPNLRFYAGAPLILKNGLKLGTLCLFDLKPNNLTVLQQKTLSVLSRQVTFLMELELSHKLLQQQIKETESKNESLRKIAQFQSHQIRQPLTAIMGLIELVNDGAQPVDEGWLKMFSKAINNFDTTIHDIVSESIGSEDL